MIKNKNYIIKITKKLKNINDISILIYLKYKKLQSHKKHRVKKCDFKSNIKKIEIEVYIDV